MCLLSTSWTLPRCFAPGCHPTATLLRHRSDASPMPIQSSAFDASHAATFPVFSSSRPLSIITSRRFAKFSFRRCPCLLFNRLRRVILSSPKLLSLSPSNPLLSSVVVSLSSSLSSSSSLPGASNLLRIGIPSLRCVFVNASHSPGFAFDCFPPLPLAFPFSFLSQLSNIIVKFPIPPPFGHPPSQLQLPSSAFHWWSPHACQ